ncbi:LSM12 homolog A-like [Sitodiplosis mosellana]|uniref:LSM12 homolog A-like n=1 Tax=Sitodiplosis mosellana TaxID=263140 RepID=UPI002443E64F|nr:LSM12 homolog A-like [Sitodiplosis mosellana]
MAAVSDCFSIGSMVSCTTCFKQSVEGEVLAFDQMSKMLILKCTSSNSSKLNDIFVVNLALCSDVQVKKEVEKVPDVPQSLNLQRLSTRVRNACEQKERWISAMSAGVGPDGQKLYMAISKTIKQVAWRGPNIVVFNDVTIKPPYKLEDVNGSPDSRQLKYVRKIVEKFLNDQADLDETTTTT